MSKIMSSNDVKLYFICGYVVHPLVDTQRKLIKFSVGFMLDAYDLFIINLITPIWTYEYFGGLTGVAKPAYPLLLRGAVNAAANIGK